MKTTELTFLQALELLNKGKRIIRKEDFLKFEFGWLYLENDTIYYMNEPLTIGADELIRWIKSDDWCVVNDNDEIDENEK